MRFSRSLFASLEIFALDHFFRPVSLLRSFGRRTRRSIPSSYSLRRRRRRKDRRAPLSAKRAEGRGESLRPTRSRRRRRRRRRRERRRRKKRDKTPFTRRQKKRFGIGIARTMMTSDENCCFLLRAAAARRTRHGAVGKKRTLRARRRYRRRAKVTHASLSAINDDFAFCLQ